ncbi:MAG: GNAT family N-acetyltransferase [Pseudomonadota bacterium]|nr:GNAT family N-acetyltransferase [Pseudomonadota bacterium]
MQVKLIHSIDEVSPSQWNSLNFNNYPFLKHEFLAALEHSGSASVHTGWKPQHLVCINSQGEIIGGMPMYLKTNPYGEFVFDFSWANAYQQAGLPYYPKFVTAIPFTPVNGPRILCANKNASKIREMIIHKAFDITKNKGCSSMHILFPSNNEIPFLKNMGMLIRKDCQFHWINNNYINFDDFLKTFSASKRKKVRRERRKIKENNIHFTVKHGNELSDYDWGRIIPLYRHTFLRYGREPYLGQNFFQEIADQIPNNLVVFTGETEQNVVSVAICFRSDNALYGRYWGATEFIDSLHFETCYYQGIDYCIENKLDLYEPGTQGEHKISRGFSPTETWSAHWLLHNEFSSAIDQYLDRERNYIDEYIDAAAEHTPYKKTE